MHKDTAKLLLTFVPIPTFVVLALGLGPRYEAISQIGLAAWFDENPTPSIAFVLAAIAAILIAVMCCFVLLAGPRDLAELIKDDNWLSNAFNRDAVGEPVFTDSSAFKNVGDKSKFNDDTVSEWQRKAYNETAARLTLLSEDQRTRCRFKWFMWIYVVCSLVLLGGVAVATATLPATPEPITKPTLVAIHVPPDAEEELLEQTGCVKVEKPDATSNAPSPTEEAIAIAVGGTWAHPDIRLIGPNCIENDWTPTPDLNAVVAPA